MKMNAFMLFLLKIHQDHIARKNKKSFPSYDLFDNKRDIPYINDRNYNHKFDIYFAKEDGYKDCLIFDIHGGFFIFGNHSNSYPYAIEFLKNGFDFCSLDYIPNTGRRDNLDLVKDCIANIRYVLTHREELGIRTNNFVITGDSAGGYLALFVSMVLTNDALREKLGIGKLDINLLGTLLTCPVYDLVNCGRTTMTNSGLKRIFGPKYKDLEWFKVMSPKTYINEFKLPLFLSTCKNDFIRNESESLNEDCKNRKEKYVYLDLDSDNEKVAHVHNVVSPELEESKQVNEAMMKFINELL